MDNKRENGDSRPEASDDLYDAVKERFLSGKVKPTNIINIITFVMTLVERKQGLSGPEKKELVISLVEHFLAEATKGSSDEEKLALQAAVQLLLPPMIDSIVSATRGQLDINRDGAVSPTEVVQVSRSCWMACFPCCFSQNPAGNGN